MPSSIITAQDMYDALLDGIRKELTATVYPAEFESLINEAQMEFVKNRYTEAEKTEKRIEDLRTLIQQVIVGPTFPQSNVFLMPYTTIPVVPGNFGVLFLLQVSFSIQYVNNVCGLTGISSFLKAKPMRRDREKEIEKDPYNKPKDSRLYYKVALGQLTLLTGTQSYGVECKMEYIKYPRSILLAPAQDSELPVHANQEIVDIAVRKYLERAQSQRYRTVINEQNNTIT